MRKVKQLVTLALAVGGATVAYDLTYRLRYPLKRKTDNEEELSSSSIDIPDSLDWIDEVNYDFRMLGDVEPYIAQYRVVSSNLVNGAVLSNHSYIQDGTYPTIFVVHGFNEFKEKYQELVYYFLQSGYNVVTYDQRGHGQSRSDNLNALVDVTDFNEYVLDLMLVQSQAKRDFSLSGHFYLYAHSMGGAVATTFLHDYPDIFKAAVLSAPMLSINSQPFSRSITSIIAKSASGFGLGTKAIPAVGANEIVDLSEEAEHGRVDPALTHSESRGGFAAYINSIFNPVPTTGGTLNWLNASMNQLRHITSSRYLAEIKIPVLLFRATEDQVVKAEGIYTAASHIPNSRLIRVNGSAHEIFQEVDSIIKPYLAQILDFYGRSH